MVRSGGECHSLAFLGFGKWTLSCWASWPPIICLTTGGHLWPAFPFRPWKHGLAIGQAIFPPKV